MFRAKEKKERALGVKLFLKAERCSSQKCATVRRPYRPGDHGKARRRPLSEYGLQLQEKQKIRFSYGISEKNLSRIFSRSAKSTGITGDMMLAILEKRLDNVTYRLGLAPSRSVARQLVSHGHFLVNGRKTTIPSYEVKVEDVISIRPQSQKHPLFQELPVILKKYDAPVWLKLDVDKLEGKMVMQPKDFEMPFNVNLVVDYYSKIT
jgi:small subunit ribosomal protein S4